MPKDGSATREKLLSAAESLIIMQGDAATSVDQVIAAAQSSKGAFFHHFPTRADLTAAVVGRYIAADLRELDDALRDVADVADPRERVIAFVRHFEDAGDILMSEQSGCVYLAVLVESDLVREATQEQVAQSVLQWRRSFVELLQAARPGCAADDIADHLFVTFEGAFALARALGDPGVMRRQLAVFRQFLELTVREG